MPRTLKIAAQIAVAFCSLYALEKWVVEPYRCNISVKRGTRRLAIAESLAPRSLRSVRLARVNIEELEPCVDALPSKISADMVLAGSYRMVGELRRALEVYELALKYDRRPELYFNLGQVQVDLGDTKSGIKNFITACLYDSAYFDAISKEQPEVKDAVRAFLVANVRRQ